MKGIKEVFWTFVVGCILIWGSFTSLHAAEGDVTRLINLLKSKNILTQQEADSLLNELKTDGQKERAEATDEIKAAAAKGDPKSQVSLGKRRSVVDPISNHGHDSPGLLEFLNFFYLCIRQHTGNYLLDAHLVSYAPGCL